jgi:hypothetical protein
LKAPQQGYRFPRIDDAGLGAIHAIDELPRRGRDAAQLTEQIQSQSFRRQYAACISAERGQPRSGRHHVAVLGEGSDLELVVE